MLKILGFIGLCRRTMILVMKVSLERLFCKVGQWIWWQKVIEVGGEYMCCA